MSTLEDFENAPVGATATNSCGGWAMKLGGSKRPWIHQNGFYMTNEGMALQGYTLGPAPAPTTVREALDTFWNACSLEYDEGDGE